MGSLQSVSYPFFSGYERNEAFPQNTDLSPVPHVPCTALTIDHANQVWSIDISYIPMAHGFMYLTAIIDVYSRAIMAWGLHNSLDAENSIEVLQLAIESHGKPEIINSDQGSQYTCPT